MGFGKEDAEVVTKPVIRSVWIFLNGMCMVFGDDTQQRTDLQGPWNEKKTEILSLTNEYTVFELAQWDGWKQPLTKDQATRISIAAPA